MLPQIGESVISDIPKLWVVFAEWLACMVMIVSYPKYKHVVGVRAGVACVLFLLITGFQYSLLTQQQTSITPWWFMFMLLSVVAMWASIWVCCDMSMGVSVFWTLRALGMAEFAASLEWQLTYFLFSTGGPGIDTEVVLGLLIICYGMLFASFFWVERQLCRRLDYATFETTWSELAVSLGIALFAFLLSNMRLLTSSNPFSGSTMSETFNIRTLASAGGLIFLYAYLFQLAEAHTRKRLDTVNQVLVAQYAQYRQSKENSDIINRKYHDLKHQLEVLRAEPDEHKREGYFDDIERSLKEYGARVVTGNGVLDTVLTSKGLLCAHHNIMMTCVVDGHLADGIDAMDLCTIVGNALDNAIEAEERIKESDKRLINVSLSRRNAFAIFKVSNYAPVEPRFHEGLPETTKDDKANHGFGMASMRHCARKYGGDMTVTWRDGWFELQVLIPLAAAE